MTLAKFCSWSLLLASLVLLSSCAWFRSEDEREARELGLPPKFKPKPPRDPVAQRVYYEGWRRPSY